MIENQVISYLLIKKSFDFIKKNNITEDYFKLFPKEFKMIKDYYEKFNKVPDEATFINRFPDFDLIVVNEPEKSLYEQLNDQYVYEQMRPVMMEAAKLMQEKKSIEAFNKFRGLIEGTKIVPTTLEAIRYKGDSNQRYNEYDKKLNIDGGAFVSTGIKELDAITGGWDIYNEYAIIAGRTGHGKAQPNSCEILTPTGSIKFGDIKIGDEILGVDGKTQKVEGVFPQGKRKVAKISFNDGSSTLCDYDHLWTIEYKSHGNIVQETLTLGEIILKYGKRIANKKYAPWLPRISPIEYSTKEFKCDPYVLGAFLGDGCLTEGRNIHYVSGKKPLTLSSGSNCIPTLIHNKIGSFKFNKSNSSNNWYFYKEDGSRFLTTEILPNELYNLNSYDKYIPEEYFYGDPEQRLNLIRGLLDTDGSCIINKKRNSCKVRFSSRSKALAEGLLRLARSLGIYGTIIKKARTKEDFYKSGPDTRISYEVSLNSSILNPFLMERKANIWTPATQFLTRKIRNIEAAGETECTCIQVSNKDQLYLTNDYIPTHNTWWLLWMAIHAAKSGKKVGIYSGEMDENSIGWRLDTLLGNIPNGSIYHGNPDIKVRYKDFIKKLSNNLSGEIFILTPQILGDSATVQDLRNFIEKYKLEFLCIDQASLLKDSKNSRTEREQLVNISKEIKLTQTLYQIPILMASQLNRDDTSQTGITTRQISGSDRLGHDATTVLFIENKKEQLTITIGKARNSRTGDKLKYQWNINKGEIKYIGEGEGGIQVDNGSSIKGVDVDVFDLG